MILYRICSAKYADDLTGMGSRLYGGRWNSVGRSMLYLASSRSLAVLEVLAHLSATNVPLGMVLLTLETPDDSTTVDVSELPDNWNKYPEPNVLKQIGNSFLDRNEYLLLKVPSALVSEEFNYLMNPMYPKTDKVKITNKSPFNFDERLL